MDLKAASIDIIKRNQSDSGAYIASPNFQTYRYSWLRDGSFIAYAMLLAGETASCARFLGWVDRVVVTQRARIEHVLRAHRTGETLTASDYLPARYHIDGTPVRDDWPNFQIDGYGAWLWALAAYVRSVGDETILLRFRESIRLALDYLAQVWSLPNFDCWEENGDRIHPSTLACLYGGIKSINELLGEKDLNALADSIRTAILDLTVDGRFRKNSGNTGVDASLLWISTPFDVVAPQDPLMRRTVREIEEELVEDGGARRYASDTYYGGGLWPLLGCWLGWHYVRARRPDRAAAIVRWVEAQADASGELPEQVSGRKTSASFRQEWERRWGAVARPLLWSHAMYLVLMKELDG